MKRLALAAVAALAIVAGWWFSRDTTKPAARAPVPSAQPAPPIVIRPASIAGTVRDASGEPLAAIVCIEERCVTADADGAYRFADVAPGAVAITASFARHAPAREGLVVDSGARHTVDLVLARGGIEVTGTVEDLLGGPIEEARVTADGAVAHTDATGQFTLWLGRPGQVLVRVNATGYGTARAHVRIPGPVSIVLAPESSIAGRVVEASGAPVGGATIRLAFNEDTATSAADGTFVLAPLAPGWYELAATAPSAYGQHHGSIALGVGERVTDVVIRVRPAFTITATVELAGDPAICTPQPVLEDRLFRLPAPTRLGNRYHFAGVPAGRYAVELGCGARVEPVVVADRDVAVTWRIGSGGLVRGRVAGARAKDHVRVGLRSIGQRFWTTTHLDDQNAFELRGIPAGTHELRAYARGIEVKSEPFPIANGETVERELVLGKVPSGRLVGRVVDAAGRPVPRATVSVMAISHRETAFAEVRDGRYELETSRGVYQAYAFTDDRHGGQHTVELFVDTDSTLDFTLAHAHDRKNPRELPPPLAPPKSYKLAGRVVDANDRPLANAIVVPHSTPSARVTTQTDGTFAIDTTYPQLDVAVHVVGGGTAHAKLDDFRTTTIRIAPSTRLTGTVTRRDGTIPPRFDIQVDGGRYLAFDHTGGAFAIDVARFPVTLVPHVFGLNGPLVTVDAPRAVALVLPTTVTVRGRIIDALTRTPIANVSVHARQARDGWAPRLANADQVTDTDGRFVLREMPTGPLQLDLLPADDTWSRQQVTITVPETDHDAGELTLARVHR